MSCIAWDMPSNFNHGDLGSVQDALTDLNKNLTNIGVIDYNNNATSISNLKSKLPSSMSVGTTYVVCSLYYQLPTGKGGTPTYTTDSNGNNVISSASYNTTNCFIRYDIIITPLYDSNTGNTVTTPTSTNTAISVIQYTSPNTTFNITQPIGVAFSSYSSYTTNNSYKLSSTKCYAVLNENHFALFWGNYYPTGTPSVSYYNIYYSNRYLICWYIYRNNGYFTVSGFNSGNGSDYSTRSTNDRITYSFDSSSFIPTNYPYSMNWVYNLPLLDSSGNINMLPTIIPNSNGTISLNETLFVTTSRNDTSNTKAVIENVMVTYNGTKVLRQFLNLNSLVAWRPYSNGNSENSYSWSIAFDNYQCTTT